MSNAGTPSMPLPYIGLRSDQGMVLLAAIAQADAQSGVEWLDRRIHIAEALSLKRQWTTADQAGFARVS